MQPAGIELVPLPGQAVFDRDKQQIAAVSRAPGDLDLFVIGFDNHAWSTFWNGAAGWNRDWFPLPGRRSSIAISNRYLPYQGSRLPGSVCHGMMIRLV